MKLVTWNVNSIRQRLPRLLALLDRHEPDVVCLQETKVEDPAFPTMEIAAAGYECATFGQRAYNGVAILSRVGLKDVRAGFEGNPLPEQSRVLAARTGDLDVVCVYVVNGKAVERPCVRDEACVARRLPLVVGLDATRPRAAGGHRRLQYRARRSRRLGRRRCGAGRTWRATPSANGSRICWRGASPTWAVLPRAT